MLIDKVERNSSNCDMWRLSAQTATWNTALVTLAGDWWIELRLDDPGRQPIPHVAKAAECVQVPAMLKWEEHFPEPTHNDCFVLSTPPGTKNGGYHTAITATAERKQQKGKWCIKIILHQGRNLSSSSKASDWTPL